MGQLAKRVILVHELRQLGRAKELFYSSRYRLDIDQRLWRDAFQILGRHPLPNHSFQPGKTDSVLIL